MYVRMYIRSVGLEVQSNLVSKYPEVTVEEVLYLPSQVHKHLSDIRYQISGIRVSYFRLVSL